MKKEDLQKIKDWLGDVVLIEYRKVRRTDTKLYEIVDLLKKEDLE